MISTLLVAQMALAAVTASTPPPIASGAGTDRATRTLVTWLPGEVRCDGSIVVAERLERPLPSLIWGGQPEGRSVSYVFDIDPNGRTSSIRPLAPDIRSAGGEDIAPSLAATRFAAGTARSGCMVSYVPRQASIDTAPISDLIVYSVYPASGPLPAEGWRRIQEEGNCRDEQNLGLEVRAFPNFRKIRAREGIREWSMVSYDLNRKGVPINVRTFAGSENAALDLAARKAVEKTRYYAGGRSGCRYAYWLTPATLPAPPAPDEQTFRPSSAACPDRRDWRVQPVLRFPEPYRRRAIEGWAIVTYDVAPWGEVGNVQVAASQPTTDFGNQAVTIIRSAKVATTQGLVGCTEKVKFVMASTAEKETN